MKFKDGMTAAEIQSLFDAEIEEKTSGLVTKNKELLGEVKSLKRKTEINPEDVEKLEAKIEELQGKLSISDKTGKQTIIERDAAIKSLESEGSFTKKLLIDNGLNDQLIKAGVSKEFMPAVKAMLSQKVNILADGDSRKAVVGDKGLDVFIGEWSLSDEGKPFISAQQNSGGGASGSGRQNAGQKTMTRTAFDSLDPTGRMDFSKSGGTLTEK